MLKAPRRFLGRSLARLIFRAFARSASDLMEPDETFITLKGEEPVNGDVWVVTDKAIYMQTRASPDNRRLGQIRTRRFPFQSLEDVTQRARGSTTELHLRVHPPLNGAQSVSGIFDHESAEVLNRSIKGQMGISQRNPD